MQPERVPPGPSVDPETGAITFRVDPDDHWQPHRVWFHLRDFGADAAFAIENGQWVARIPRPPVLRLEYLLEIAADSGEQQLVCDPGNPVRVPGVFGDKSVVTLPGYAEPAWLTAGPDPAGPTAGRSPARLPRWQVVALDGPRQIGPGRDLRRARWTTLVSADEAADVAPAAEHAVLDPTSAVAAVGTLLAPADSGSEDVLPLLLVHDGPEYARLAALTLYLGLLARREPALRCRVLLLRPVDRDRSYSASPGYARALAEGLLPEVRETVATREPVVGMGASLGGLAMLHVAVTHPGSVTAVFSQSGSFFAAQSDPMELTYRFFDRIADFVATLDGDPMRLRGLSLTLTCGTGEENLANNRRLRQRLHRAGMPVPLIENPDGHTYVGWRDCLDPALADLLRASWGGG